MQYILRQIEQYNPFPTVILLNTEREVTIGRQTVASMVKYGRVSRKHAVLRHIRNAWYVRESEGKETYVNFVKIGKKFHQLNVGDIIGFGAPFINEKDGFVCVLTIQHKVKQEDLESNFSLNSSKSNDEAKLFSYNNYSELNEQHFPLFKQESMGNANNVHNSIPSLYNLSNITSSKSSAIRKQNNLQNTDKISIDECHVDTYRNDSSSITDYCNEENKTSSNQYFKPYSHDGICMKISDNNFILSSVNNTDCHTNCTQNDWIMNKESLELNMKSSPISRKESKSDKLGSKQYVLDSIPSISSYYNKQINKIKFPVGNIKKNLKNSISASVSSPCSKENYLTDANAVSSNVQIADDPYCKENTSDSENCQYEQFCNQKLNPGIQLRECSVMITPCDSKYYRHTQYHRNSHGFAHKLDCKKEQQFQLRVKRNRTLSSESSDSDCEMSREGKLETISTIFLNKNISLKLKKNRIVSSESSESDQDIEKKDTYCCKTIRNKSSNGCIQIKSSKEKSATSQLRLGFVENLCSDTKLKNQKTSDSISETGLNHKVDYGSTSSVSSSSEIILYPSPHVLHEIEKVASKKSCHSRTSVKFQQTNFKHLNKIEINKDYPKKTVTENSTSIGLEKLHRTKHRSNKFLKPNAQGKQNNVEISSLRSMLKSHKKKRMINVLKSNRGVAKYCNDQFPCATIMVGSSAKNNNYKIPKCRKAKNRQTGSEHSNFQLKNSKLNILKVSSVLNKSRILRMENLKNFNINSSPYNNSFFGTTECEGNYFRDSRNALSNYKFDKSKRINYKTKSTIRNRARNNQFPEGILTKYIELDKNEKQIKTREVSVNQPRVLTGVTIQKDTTEINAYSFVNKSPIKNGDNFVIRNQTLKNANDASPLGKNCEIRSQNATSKLVEENLFTLSQNEHKNNKIVETSHCKFPIIHSPSLGELLIQWTPKWLEEQKDYTKPAPLIPNELSVLPPSFTDYSIYFSSFYHVIVLDMWQLMCKKSKYIIENEFMNWNNFYCIITSSSHKDNILELRCQSIVSDKLPYSPVHGNAILLNVQDMKRKMENCIFGFVTEHKLHNSSDWKSSTEWQKLPRKWMVNAKLCTFTIIIQNRRINLDFKSLMLAYGICSIKLNLILMESLRNLPHSRLCGIILQPNQNNWSSTKVPTDISQQNFIQHMCDEIIENNIHPQIFLLQGAPGTGKTYSILKLVEMLLFSGTNNLKILVCAPTDSVLDEIGLRIIELKERCSWRSRPVNFIRVGYSSQVHPKLHPYHFDTVVSKRLKTMFQRKCLNKEKKLQDLEREINGVIQLFIKKDDLSKNQEKLRDMMNQYESLKLLPLEDLERNLRSDCKSVILEEAEIILSTLEFFRDYVSNSTSATCCIVDSVSLCTESEILPCLVPGVHKLVIVGDAKQRKPADHFQYTERYGHRRSLFERFYDCFKNRLEYPVFNLKMQHRMHSEICRFPSSYFYANEIETSPEADKRYQYFPLRPYVVIDILDSHTSTVTAKDVFQHVCSVISETVSSASIGAIVDPSHRNLYEASLSHFRNIEVSTVDGFYNKEKDVVMISHVRTTHATEFLASDQEFNIALTRARQCLIIYGHLSGFQHHKHWKELLQDAKVRNIYKAVSHVTQLPRVLKKSLSTDE